MDNSNEITDLKEEILNLSKKIEKVKEKEISKDLMDELKKIIEQLNIDSLKDEISEEKLKEKSKHVINEIEEFTKNHPIAALLGAFGIGCLIGKILK